MKYDKGCVALYVWQVQGGNYNIFKGPKQYHVWFLQIIA